MQAVRESGMKVEAQLEPCVLTSAAGEDSMSSGSVDVTSSSGDSSLDEGLPLPPPAQFEVRHTKPALSCAKMPVNLDGMPKTSALKFHWSMRGIPWEAGFE